ncbi:MAG TPA: hypothetical protein VFB83_08755 [Propionibacteriaceae bacterium]|nr:hypothetical protein [Propionibacteriaceae bacterium]
MTSTAPSEATLKTGQTKNLILALLGFTITSGHGTRSRPSVSDTAPNWA